MSEVKNGDWVEVTKTDKHDDRVNVSVGHKFLVLGIVNDGVEIRLRYGDNWWLSHGQYKKC